MTDPKTPAQVCHEAAEGVRRLNHATFGAGRPDWESPADAYSVIGGLENLTAYLPQALGQIGMLLSSVTADGRMGSTTGNVKQDVVEALTALNDARMAAAALNHTLQRAHNAASVLTYED
jgi:hypothetical protein